MENQRLLLLLALLILGAFIIYAWDVHQRDPAPVEEVVEEPEEDPEAPAAPDAPEEPEPPEEREPEDVVEPEEEEERRIHVVTDVLDLEISTRGGDIRRADLLGHQTAVDDPTPFRLLADDRDPLHVVQSGLRAEEGEGPTHQERYRAEADRYELGDDEEKIEVPLRWEGDGIEVRKVYTFHRDSYLVDLRHEVRNATAERWRAYQYTQLRRQPEPPGTTPWYIYTYTGGVIFSPEDRYEKIDFDDMAAEDLARDIRDGWAAMLQHYFVSAIVPPREETRRYYTRALADQHFVLGMSSPWGTAEPDDGHTFRTQLYIGPKEQHRLRAVDAQDFHLTVDYGFLNILSQPLFWLLDFIEDYVGNWGWAIVILTLLIKIAFYKLSEIAYRSMARMRKVQPRMQQIKERYADDRQRMNQAMMELYRKEKINPMGGCLPILIQIPVFIALYWVLIESVELRHAPFIFWIQDLTSRDPFFILPLLMGASMLAQQWLNPAPVDPVQKRIMQILPFAFTAFFMLFPAGLVLYWLANNLLSIGQQWLIIRRMDKEDAKGGD